MQSWVKIDKNSDFSIYNIPFGIFSTDNKSKRVGIAIGELILDLYSASSFGIFNELNIDKEVFNSDYLNNFISQGKQITSKVRLIIQKERI